MNVGTLTHFVRNQGNGVKGLSEMGLNSLPKQYIQPEEERISEQNITKEAIPIIDFSNPDNPEVRKSICSAAEKWGFFQVVNHGIPIHVLENVKEATYEFFGLPAEEKIKYLKENSPSNNVRLETSFVPQYENAMEWKDYLSLFFVSEEEASAIWPPACRDRVLEYMKQSDILIEKLLDVLMKGLSINKIEGNLAPQLIGTKRVNLNFYPICPNPELTVGVGRHSDVSTFTILLQDEVGGLYVRGGSGSNSWIHVNPISGSLVINIGDALQIMSNGRYKSAEHKVIANGSKDRISVPLFVNPRPSDIIGPLPEVIEKSGKEAVYKNVLYSDYVKHFYKKAHDGKRTLDFAKI